MTFPQGFLWGSATAAHQVEGNNVNSDIWLIEHSPITIFKEPSGDACDHYRLYRQDLALLKELGLNSYRFSIEWARVEPEDGWISRAALQHYGDVLRACHEFGLTPIVTMHHFSSPRWLMRQGGWANPATAQRFAAYCRAVMDELGSLIPYVCTLNEANITVLLESMNIPVSSDIVPPEVNAPIGANAEQLAQRNWKIACADLLNTSVDQFKPFIFSPSAETDSVIMEAHQQARAAIKAVSPSTQVGITFALNDVQAVDGGDDRANAMIDTIFRRYIPICADDDFIGVQNYSRLRVNEAGILPGEEGVEVTQMGYEFYPQALENVIRMVAKAGKPMIVTENGLSTEDDSRRVAFIQQALQGVERCLADGIDVRGYMYWSALDNFEWTAGYGPKFGIIGVDRSTQTRHVKPSARYLGAIARQNTLIQPITEENL